MNGFGTIDKKDINVLISSIENRINFIRNDINQNVTSLKNQLNACTEELNRLKKLVIQVTNYNDSEYQKLENRINQFDSDIEDIKSKLNTIQYNEIAAGKCASGINEYPIYAKYAENDTNGNIIPEYYAAKYDLSNVSSTLSADYTKKIAESSSGGMSALSSVSGILTTNIERETQERSEADIIIKNSIVSETSRATNAENELLTNLNGEIKRATGIETGLRTDLEEEITKAINTEKTERESDIEELNTNKQNNLTAGDGISISNDVISHSIKIIENNNEEDKVEGTTFTVYLKNNHYKIITFDKTITSIKFIIESSTNNVLQETGFEFTCPDESELEQINFEVKDNPNKKIYTILPDSYTGLNIYQGTIVNYKCTIGEYEVEN